MRRFLQIFLLFAFGLLTMSSCTNAYRVTSVVYEDLYRIDSEFSHDAFIRQSTPDSAYMYFKIRTGHLLHKRKGEEAPFTVKANIELLRFNDIEGQSDTLKYQFQESYDAISDELVFGRLPIAMKDTLAYELRILIKDVHSKKEKELHHFLSTEGTDKRYTHLLINGVPSRFCDCSSGDEVLIFPYGWGEGYVTIKEYDVKQSLAPPPFSINTRALPKLDYIKSYGQEYDGGIRILCPQADLIEFTQEELDSSLDVPIFSSDYPGVRDYQTMVNALKYITTSTEFKELNQSSDIQLAMEEFWIECGGSKERARVLIEQYYSRVEEANLYFSDIAEGWKTDRGLVHIIYGPPARIMRYPDREIWYYGPDSSDSSLKMSFYVNENYTLDRSLDYRQSWYLTVDSWRNGRTINP